MPRNLDLDPEPVITCDDCHSVVPESSSYDTGHGTVCGRCFVDYRRCTDCDEWFPRRRMYHDGSTHYCPTCFQNDHFRCSDCRHIFEDQERYTNSDGNDYCEDCYPGDDDDDEYTYDEDYSSSRGRTRSDDNRHMRIHEHFYKPNLKFFRDQGETTDQFFGLEIEMNGRGGIVNNYDFDLTSKHFWECYDGSVDMGHETVSYPMSYYYIMKNRPFDPLCQMARNVGYVSEESSQCGLHVHISRSIFGDRFVSTPRGQGFNFGEEEGNHDWGYFTDGVVKGYFGGLRLHKFIYLFEKFWKEVVVFSRREHDFGVCDPHINEIDKWCPRWDSNCRYSDPTEFDPDPDSNNYKTFIELWNKISNRTSRYHVTNVENKQSIEVRIFKGSLDPGVILACIQLVKLFFELSEWDVKDLEDITWDGVRRIADSAYPELTDLCDRRRL